MGDNIIGLFPTTVAQLASKAIELGKKTQNKGYHGARLLHDKIHLVVTSW